MSLVNAPEKQRKAMNNKQLALESPPSAPRLRPVAKSQPIAAALPWYATTWALSAISSVLLWAAFPPLNFGLLAWVAPLGWLALIRANKLPGKQTYLAIWLTSLVHWLALLYFVTLPHWAAIFGWVALGLYLSVYLPLFVGLARVAVVQLKIPLLIAAPAIWTGLELLRSYLFTGFSVALLGHTQVGFPAVIQIADLCGAYGVSFVVMFVAACLASLLPIIGRQSPPARRWWFWPALPLAGVLTATLAYGFYRLNETPPNSDDGRVAKVALIQGCYPTSFEFDPQAARDNFDRYIAQTEKACRQHPDLDLAIWPESMFASAACDILVEGENSEIELPPGKDLEDMWKYQAHFQDEAHYAAFKINHARGKNAPAGNTRLLVGCETDCLGPYSLRRYNSALLIDPKGRVEDRYYKMHRVMFGEYVPLGDLIPWLYTLTPMPGGLTAGKRAEEFSVAGLRLAPSVCFETTVPHVIRRQVRQLEREDTPPDVLVNLTNDGWFHGSSALDLHLTCGVFRAIEQRRPLLIAANTGFSAFIDGNGTVLEKGPRFAEGVLVREVRADGRNSLYRRIGDLPVWACSLLVGVAAVVGFVGRWRGRKQE